MFSKWGSPQSKLAALVLLPLGLSLMHPTRAAAQNLVNNGNFELGNTGFSTDYTYWTGNNSGSGPGGYQIGNNADNDNALWVDPETPGSNNYMYVDGSMTPDQSFFTQNVQGITAGKTYLISASFASLYNENDPLLVFKNGDNAISSTYDINNVGSWKTYSFDWTATSNTLNLDLVDQDLVHDGNDFAVDNISVRAVPEASTIVLFSLLAGAGILLLRKRSASAAA